MGLFRVGAEMDVIFVDFSRTKSTLCTGRIQIRVLTNCQAISTEIDTDSLKI